MVNYKCVKCGKNYTDKAQYARHLNRKYTCNKNIIPLKPAEKITENAENSAEFAEKTAENLLNFAENLQNSGENNYNNLDEIKKIHQCKYCNKILTRNYHLKKHLETCKVKQKLENSGLIKEETKDNGELVIKMIETIKEHSNLIYKLSNENKELNDKLISLSKQETSGTITNSNNNNSNNNNINNGTINNTTNNTIINVLPFGQEDLSHLTDEDYEKIIKKRRMCIFEYLKKVHFDLNKPENHNVILHNKRENHIEVYNKEDNWEIQKADEVIKLMVDKGTPILINYYEDNKNKKIKIVDKHYERFINEYNEGDEEFFDAIYEDLKIEIFNQSRKIKKNKKDTKKEPKTIKQSPK